MEVALTSGFNCTGCTMIVSFFIRSLLLTLIRKSMVQSFISCALICMILTVCKADIVLNKICNRFQDKSFCPQSNAKDSPAPPTIDNLQKVTQRQSSTMAPNSKTDFCSQNKNNFVGYCAAKAGQYALDRAVYKFCNDYLEKCDTTKNSLPNTPGLGSMPGGPSYLPTIPQMMSQYLGNYYPASSPNNLYQMPTVGAGKVMNVAPQKDPTFMGMPIVPMLNNMYYMMGLPSTNEMMAMMSQYPMLAKPQM